MVPMSPNPRMTDAAQLRAMSTELTRQQELDMRHREACTWAIIEEIRRLAPRSWPQNWEMR